MPQGCRAPRWVRTSFDVSGLVDDLRRIVESIAFARVCGALSSNRMEEVRLSITLERV
jgi:hypothetical protein